MTNNIRPTMMTLTMNNPANHIIIPKKCRIPMRTTAEKIAARNANAIPFIIVPKSPSEASLRNCYSQMCYWSEA